jgi:hypothetical protein
MDPEKLIAESESAPEIPVAKPIKIVLKCSRCIKVLDPIKEPDPYVYAGNGRLCKTCVSELRLGKNQDAYLMGAHSVKME